ncbi:MAG: cell division protein ZapA [Flavobacteriales bacterium]|jgi:cell division protein ZapA|nr:cell division protein ZapA [Flavobacteriales bacterium]
MGDLSIKIKIANRVYPLTINAKEEEGVRKVADEINKSIAEYEKLYAVKDYQDLLAMVALKLVSTNYQKQQTVVDGDSNLEESLLQIEQLFDNYL